MEQDKVTKEVAKKLTEMLIDDTEIIIKGINRELKRLNMI